MWTTYQNIIYYIPQSYNPLSIDKVAIFDLDGTLITRLNGSNPKYPEKNSSNWIFLGDIETEFENLYLNKYQLIILTNQLKFNNITFDKIKQIQKTLNKLDVIFFISLKDDIYRKPNLGIFEILNIDITLIKDGFVCGDAIGEDDPYPPYRWSSVDYLFYQNLNILNSNIKFIRPIDLFESNISDVIDYCYNIDVIIMMGNMGSGKSTFSKSFYSRVIIESDLFKNKNKMFKVAEENLINNKKIVIDATNFSKEKRKVWIDLAKKYSKSYLIVFSIKDGRPFNQLREKKIPEIAYATYSKNFENVDDEEGNFVWIW